MRIAIVAFEALPAVGTEAGLAWNWGSAYRSLGHEVSVFSQPAGRSSASDELWRLEGIETVFVGDMPSTLAPRGPREMVRNFFRYARWTRDVTAELKKHGPFDLVHQVSLSSIRLPWVRPTRDTVFVLGPVGGAHVPPLRSVLRHDLLGEVFRIMSIPTLGVMRAIDVRFRRRPDLTFVTNDGSREFARRIGLRSVEPMLSDGISPKLIVDRPRNLDGPQRRLVWAGRMVGSKRPDIALEVLARMRRWGVDVSLVMVGDGPELDALRAKATKLALDDSVDFTGRVPWHEVIGHYERADAFLFTSVRDSSCPGVLEAAARGRPSIAIRHQGVGFLVPADVALGPDSVGAVNVLIDELSEAGVALFSSDEGYLATSERARVYAATETWDLKAQRVLGVVS